MQARSSQSSLPALPSASPDLEHLKQPLFNQSDEEDDEFWASAYDGKGDWLPTTASAHTVNQPTTPTRMPISSGRHSTPRNSPEKQKQSGEDEWPTFSSTKPHQAQQAPTVSVEIFTCFQF